MAKKGRRVRNAASKARANQAAAKQAAGDQEVDDQSLPSSRKATPRTRRRSSSKARAAATAAAARPKLSPEEQFRLEYAYVLKDLRWVFILAGIMFAILIALNLILA